MQIKLVEQLQTVCKHVLESIPKSRLGRCYELSGRYVMDHSGTELIHGTITRQDGYTISHAWVEYEETVGQYKIKMTYDPVMDQELPWDAYERMLGAKIEKRYTKDQMIETMFKDKKPNWGPWESKVNEDELFPIPTQDDIDQRTEEQQRETLEFIRKYLQKRKAINVPVGSYPLAQLASEKFNIGEIPALKLVLKVKGEIYNDNEG